MSEICNICGDVKFEVFTQDGVYYRCINCEPTLSEVIKANGKKEITNE